MSRHHEEANSSPSELALGRAWREHRRYVLDIAFRMVGNLAEAEDVVQEAFSRLIRSDVDEIEDVRAWLVVVVSRLCLDKWRFDRRHPTGAPPAELVSEPTAGLPDPADRVTLDDSVGLAMHLVLERLSPAERTVFVLHDVFQFTFEEVGDIVGRSPAACRQLASRARRTMRTEAGAGRFAVESAEERQVTERFITACSTGDLEALLAVLDPDVDGVVELAPGITPQAPVEGRDNVMPRLLLFFGPKTSTTLLSLPIAGRAGVVAIRDQRIVAVISLRISGGRVDHLHSIADPAKLAPLNATLGAG
ncbi:MAG TPA: sigma-70 family RNA polymerase sigma factor [Acidimicrobiales bacterium]|jgi:RNA polymerase sigma-70 factor (ECF subfamily)